MSIYGCYNEPRPVAGKPLRVQDGWFYGHADRIARIVVVPYVMTVPCQYTQHHPTDPECAGCPHQSKGVAPCK